MVGQYLFITYYHVWGEPELKIFLNLIYYNVLMNDQDSCMFSYVMKLFLCLIGILLAMNDQDMLSYSVML